MSGFDIPPFGLLVRVLVDPLQLRRRSRGSSWLATPPRGRSLTDALEHSTLSLVSLRRTIQGIRLYRRGLAPIMIFIHHLYLFSALLRGD